jgi:hypothetical protein
VSDQVASEPGTRPAISGHPRARGQIRRAKGWGGLAGCALVAYYSHRAGVPFPDVAARSIAGGLIGWLVAWMVVLQVWRQLTIAEVRRREHEWLRRRAATAGSLEETMILKPGAAPDGGQPGGQAAA